MTSTIFEKFYFRLPSDLEPEIPALYEDRVDAQNKKNRRHATKDDGDICILRKKLFLLFPVSRATPPQILRMPGSRSGPASFRKV